MHIKDQLTELLAIKLYEHDHYSWPLQTHHDVVSWLELLDEDREIFRRMAGGLDPIPSDNGG